MTPTSPKRRRNLWTAALCGTALVPIPTMASGQGIGWFVELAPDPSALIVYVDARHKPVNEKLENVTYSVEFLDANGRRIKSDVFKFTDSKHPLLVEPRLYQKIEHHRVPNAAAVKGVALNWGANITGDKVDDPGQRVPPAERRFAVPASQVVILPSGDRIIAPPPSLGDRLSGNWSVTLRSLVSNQVHRMPARIAVTPQGIFGTLDVSDGSNRQLRGRMPDPGDSITLIRDTGLNTTQYYRLGWRGRVLVGRFWNVGQYSDSGWVDMRR